MEKRWWHGRMKQGEIQVFSKVTALCHTKNILRFRTAKRNKYTLKWKIESNFIVWARARDASIPIVTNSILLSFIIDFDCSINSECGVQCIGMSDVLVSWDRCNNKFYSGKIEKKAHRRIKLRFIIINVVFFVSSSSSYSFLSDRFGEHELMRWKQRSEN